MPSNFWYRYNCGSEMKRNEDGKGSGSELPYEQRKRI
jgi:hypothetical protein